MSDIGPKTEVLCRGCSKRFDVGVGKDHVLDSLRDSKCHQWKRLDIFGLRIGSNYYHRLHPNAETQLKGHTAALLTHPAVMTYTVLKGGYWRAQHPIRWGLDWAVLLAEMSIKPYDKGEALQVLTTCLKDFKQRSVLLALMTLATEDTPARGVLDYSERLVLKYGAVQRFLEEKCLREEIS